MFRTMPVVPGAAEALWRLSDAGVWIRLITHRLYANWGHAVAVADTVAWLDEHAIPYRDLCFLGDKPQVEADAYVDDAPHNVEALRATGRRCPRLQPALQPPASPDLVPPGGPRSRSGCWPAWPPEAVAVQASMPLDGASEPIASDPSRDERGPTPSAGLTACGRCRAPVGALVRVSRWPVWAGSSGRSPSPRCSACRSGVSLWALLDCVRHPQWAWALSGRRQVVWLVAILFGFVSVVGGLVISGWYL